jgi:hypothetical protein
MSDAHTKTLGNLAMIWDIMPTRLRPKLGVVEAGTPEFDYMLAAIVFDLVKKNALAVKLLRSYLLHADPEITRSVLEDVRALEPLEQDYEALAHATHERMLAVVAEVLDDHIQLGDMVLRWHGGAAGRAG